MRASDGHYVAGIHEIIHGENDKANIYVASNGMYYDSYGIIYMAFGTEKHDKGMSSEDGSMNDEAPKVAVAAFEGSTLTKVYYHHMSIFFGEAFALTYADYGASGSNVFIGGVVDTCYYSPGGSTPSCWVLSINRMTSTGYNESQR